MSTAEMQRQIEKTHQVKIGKTQFYAYVDQVTNGTAPEPEGGLFMPLKSPPIHSPVNKEPQEFHHTNTLIVRFDEVRQELANVITWLSRMDEQAEQREQRTREALQQSQQMTGEALGQFQQALSDAIGQMETASAARPPEVLRPTVNPTVTSAFRLSQGMKSSFALPAPRGWRHAVLYSGLAWGAGILLFGYGYWRPLWALLVSVLSPVIASLPLHA